MELTCKKCGVEITKRKRSGYCTPCRRNLQNSKYRKSPAGKAGRAQTKAIRHDDSMFPHVGKIVKCHNSKNPHVQCPNRVRLQWWQHPQMAWCADCRKDDAYKFFSGGTPATRGGFYDRQSGQYVRGQDCHIF